MQCRVSRSKLVKLKVLLCTHDCCNKSIHGIVLRQSQLVVKGMMMGLNMMGMNNRG